MFLLPQNSKFNSVILISHEMTFTGAPRSLLNLCIVLKECGFEVAVYTICRGGFEKEFLSRGIEVNQFSIVNISIPNGSLVIFNTIYTAKLIDCIPNKDYFSVLFLREAKNLRDILVNFDVDQRTIDLFSEVLCVSEYSSDYINGLFSTKKALVLHNYVDDVFSPSINLPKDRVVNFLVSGTYEKRKGIDLVVDAFMRMPDSLKSITRLHIVGPKPDWSKDYQEEVAAGYDNRIIEHGEISDDKARISLYKKMNVFLIPSRDDACSLVALEGAMLGKAIIMSENVGAKYLFTNREWIYSTDDVDSLCRKMCNLTSRKRLMIEGMNNRRAYKRTSTKQIYKRNLIEILNIIS